MKDAPTPDPLDGLGLAQAARKIRGSRQMHTTWYRETYPDVAASGMEPAEHYLKYGAAMGRDPGRGFDTRGYLEAYPDAAASGINPLLHWVRHGQARGYARRPECAPSLKEQVAAIHRIRDKLRSLGFTEAPLRELEEIVAAAPASPSAALAARELALWHMHARTESGYRQALARLDLAGPGAPDLEFRRRLTTMRLLCHHHLGETRAGHDLYEAAALAGEVSVDTQLAYVNYQDDPADRMLRINRVLDAYGMSPLALMPDDGTPPYDRLVSAAALPGVAGGPTVSVLIAAYDAADTLPTALRGLCAQTWANLEILVIDDCSPGPATRAVVEAHAARDPRIRLVTMPVNGGAYVARNRGLDLARGTYVTLHDSDDWSHPAKIETQVRFLEANPQAVACTTQQSRATDALGFVRLNSRFRLLNLNTSSFMFRRDAVARACGGWDDVRFAADTEMLRRIARVFGEDGIRRLSGGPFSFQRISDTSIVGDPHFGMEGFHYGARFTYREAYREHHAAGGPANYRGTDGPAFPKPYPMRWNRVKSSAPRHFDVIHASDFRMVGGSTRSSVEEMKCAERNGIGFAMFQMSRYDFATTKTMFNVMQPELDMRRLEVLGYGEAATCDLLILRYPPVLQHPQRYLPKIEAGEVKVIVNQTPMSDYGPGGDVRFTFEACARNLRAQFGTDATWHPIGPLVRDALNAHHADALHHIELSDEDWHNIIDIAGWDRGPRARGPADRLRIGRHSRDAAVKWPATREDVLAAYPASDDVEVHVLGGAKSPGKLIGGVPGNWTVHGFGTVHPRDFLAGLDVFVYFAHPDWVESFGRTIIEAMAVGLPVILPEVYRPLFGEAALYATPGTAVALARALHADPARYDAQVARARALALERFSYQAHLKRLGRTA